MPLACCTLPSNPSWGRRRRFLIFAAALDSGLNQTTQWQFRRNYNFNADKSNVVQEDGQNELYQMLQFCFS